MRTARRLLALASGAIFLGMAHAAPVFINEIHYDNSGTDTGEAIEIAGPAGTNLGGWSLVLYNGANGLDYSTTALSGLIPNQQSGFGTLSFSYPTNGIQNGSPDGVALVDSSNAVVQFLSYEGSFVAGAGPAAGLASTDIGVSESGSSAIGSSLQLSGAGMSYAHFAWQASGANTFGGINTGQTFLSALATPVINEVLASHTGTDDTEFIELYGAPGSVLAGLSLIVVESDAISTLGRIDRRIDFGGGDVIGANGFFLIGNPAGLGTNYGVVPNMGIDDNFLENSSMTMALVATSSLSGSAVTGAEIVTDVLALFDDDPADVAFFGAPVIGPDGPFFPAGARRVADGVDTDTAADWAFADFNLGRANTPTAGTAQGAPEPATLALLGVGLAGIAASRRRRK